MKKIGLSLVLTGALALFNGCGSSSGNPAGDDDGKKNESSQKQKNEEPKTGTGYYKDSAVEGVSYVCGSKKGITDKQGKFIFEKGKSCTFTLAGMTLRAVKASALHDSVEVVEDNATIYTLLQTLDSDGNASNGITILPKVVEQLKKVQVALPASPAEVANVHNDIKNVEGYHGKLKTEDEAKVHVVKTQTEVTKKLLAGKTFYAAYHEDDGTLIVEKDTVNQDATKIKWQNIQGNSNNGTADITKIDGKHATIEGDDGKIDNTELLEVTDKWVKFQDDDGEIKIFYFSEADAKAAPHDASSVPASNQNDLKALFAGKTLFSSYNNEEGANIVEKLVFNNNVTSVHWEEIEGGSESEDDVLTIEGDTLISHDNEGSQRHKLIEVTDKYIKLEVPKDDGSIEIDKLYFSEADAKAALDGGLPNQNANDLKALLAGKTWYIPVDETHQKDDGTTVINDHVEQLTFKDNGTIHNEWQENGETKTWDNVTYEISGNQLHLGGTDGDGNALDETLTLKSNGNSVLIFDGEDNQLYKDKSAAQAWLDAHPSQENTTQNDLKALLTGKTLFSSYNNEEGANIVEKLVFNNNVTSVHWNQIEGGSESGDDVLTIEGDTLISHDNEGSRRHKLIEVTDKYIKLEVPKDDGSIKIDKLYFSEADAKKALESSDANGGSEQRISNLVNGHFNFEDENNSIVANIPSNLWVRITPKDNQIEGHWNGVNCHIDNNGNFGSECYIHSNESDMRTKFSSSYGKSYQVVIYQETTGNTHYNREEQQYGHIQKDGDVYDVNYGAWQNAIVVSFGRQ